MRNRLEALALRLGGVPTGMLVVTLLRLTARRVGLAVVFHATGEPPGDPARELVPKLGKGLFDAQLRYMRRCFRLVPASELLDAARLRRPGPSRSRSTTTWPAMPRLRPRSSAAEARPRPSF